MCFFPNPFRRHAPVYLLNHVSIYSGEYTCMHWCTRVCEAYEVVHVSVFFCTEDLFQGTAVAASLQAQFSRSLVWTIIMSTKNLINSDRCSSLGTEESCVLRIASASVSWCSFLHLVRSAVRLSLCETNAVSWPEVVFPCLGQLQEVLPGGVVEGWSFWFLTNVLWLVNYELWLS